MTSDIKKKKDAKASYTVSVDGDRLNVDSTGFPNFVYTHSGKDDEGRSYEFKIETDGKKSVTVNLKSKGLKPNEENIKTNLVFNREGLAEISSKALGSNEEPLRKFLANNPLSQNHNVSFEVYLPEESFGGPELSTCSEETTKSITPTTLNEFGFSELEPFEKYRRTLDYLPNIQNSVDPKTNIISIEKIESRFEGFGLGVVKRFLKKLESLDSKPIKKTNGNYEICDREVFSKIRKAAELNKKFGSVTRAYYIKKLKDENVISATKNRVSIKEIRDALDTEKEKRGVAISLSPLKRRGVLEIKGKGENREYIFDPEFLRIDISLEKTN